MNTDTATAGLNTEVDSVDEVPPPRPRGAFWRTTAHFFSRTSFVHLVNRGAGACQRHPFSTLLGEGRAGGCSLCGL